MQAKNYHSQLRMNNTHGVTKKLYVISSSVLAKTNIPAHKTATDNWSIYLDLMLFLGEFKKGMRGGKAGLSAGYKQDDHCIGVMIRGDLHFASVSKQVLVQILSYGN